MKVLFLFESVLPVMYHQDTISPGELRVIAAQAKVETVVALGPAGNSFYDVSVIQPIVTGVEQKITLHHFRWPRNPLAYYLTFMGLLWHGFKLYRENTFDVIHAESPHISGIAAVILGKIFHSKIIIEYRVSYDDLLISRYGKIGKIIKPIFWAVASAVIKLSDCVAANSQTYQRELKKRFPQKLIMFYNPGVRIPKNFKKISHKNFVIGFIGRLYPDKGPHYFVEMVRQGEDWFRQNNIKFILAGDGPMKSFLENRINSLYLDDILIIKGTMNRWDFFSHIDMLINTTIVNAALEMNIAEAASIGLPSVVFGDSSLPETILNNETGYVVPVKDIKILFKKTETMIVNKNRYQQFSLNAISHGKLYSFTSQLNNIKTLYEQLCP